jgi:hypothetical protein
MTLIACGSLLLLAVIAVALMVGGSLLLGALIPDLLRRKRQAGSRRLRGK